MWTGNVSRRERRCVYLRLTPEEIETARQQRLQNPRPFSSGAKLPADGSWATASSSEEGGSRRGKGPANVAPPKFNPSAKRNSKTFLLVGLLYSSPLKFYGISPLF